MIMTDQSKRPELGDVKVGDELLVIPSSGGSKYTDTTPVPVRVVKAARVWLEMVRTDGWHYAREYRMRRDTQDDANGTNYRARFVTAEQYAWERERNAAFTFLFDQGIHIDSQSRWRGREVELAAIIRAATEA